MSRPRRLAQADDDAADERLADASVGPDRKRAQIGRWRSRSLVSRQTLSSSPGVKHVAAGGLEPCEVDARALIAFGAMTD